MSNLKVHWKQRGSAAGNIVTLLLLLGIIGLGVYLWLGKKAPDGDTASTGTQTSQSGSSADGEPGLIPRASCSHVSLLTRRRGLRPAW